MTAIRYDDGTSALIRPLRWDPLGDMRHSGGRGDTRDRTGDASIGVAAALRTRIGELTLFVEPVAVGDRFSIPGVARPGAADETTTFALLATALRGAIGFGRSRADHPFGIEAVPPGRMVALTSTDGMIRVGESGELLGLLIPLDQCDTGPSPFDGVLPDSALARSAPAFLSQLVQHLTSSEDLPVPRLMADVLIDLSRALLADATTTMAPDDLHQAIRLAVDDIIERTHRDPRTTVSTIAQELHLSRRQLYRYFAPTGVAPLIARRRVETARTLITQNPQLPMREVARRAGFGDVDRLRTHFQQRLGVSPRQFRMAIGVVDAPGELIDELKLG